MTSSPLIRAALPSDAAAVAALLVEAGYPADPDGVAPLLAAPLAAPRDLVIVAEVTGEVLGVLTLSTRPLLALGGLAGSIDLLAVRSEARGRGIGDRLLQYAKGLATAWGLVRLELSGAPAHEAAIERFFLERGFLVADAVAYRWSPMEARYPPLPYRGPAARREVA